MDEQLKRAVAMGDFAAALALLPVYSGWLESEFRRLPAESEEARALARRAHALFRWARTAVLCGRAHCAARLEQSARRAAYLQPPPSRNTWELRG